MKELDKKFRTREFVDLLKEEFGHEDIPWDPFCADGELMSCTRSYHDRDGRNICKYANICF